ncbi:phosphate ABC transporter permease PstA [soil metagenome]
MALATPALGGRTAGDVVRANLTKSQRDVPGLLALIALLTSVLVTILVLFTLIGTILVDAVPFLRDRGGSFVTRTIGSNPDVIGLWPGLYGSFIIGLGVIVIAFPLGIAAAVYLEEYAKPTRFTRFVQINIRNLAGVPAVVYGVLGFTIFAGWLGGLTGGKTVIAAALTLAVLVLPIVMITSMEAIRAVPQGIRDAGYGVGASRWETIRDHVLSYAAPGILTGTVLSLARALGEAAPLIVVGALAGGVGLLPETSLDGKFTALPMLIYGWSGQPTDADNRWQFSNSAAAASVILLALVLFFNFAAILVRNRYERTRTGS